LKLQGRKDHRKKWFVITDIKHFKKRGFFFKEEEKMNLKNNHFTLKNMEIEHCFKSIQFSALSLFKVDEKSFSDEILRMPPSSLSLCSLKPLN